MLIDLRRPTIVIAGAFNPAIFTPEWIAAVVHQIPEGTDVEGTMVVDTSRGSVRPYINGVGVAVENERLTAAWDDIGADGCNIAEGLVRRVAEALPHTPANGVGVNFHFEEDDFAAELVDLLSPKDDPAQLGVVEQTDLKSRIQLDDCTLNLTRSICNNKFVCDFNYHHPLNRLPDLLPIFDGTKTYNLLNRSKQTIESLYDLDADDLEFVKALAK